jgi:hypothetical protein
VRNEISMVTVDQGKLALGQPRLAIKERGEVIPHSNIKGMLQFCSFLEEG